MKKNTQRAEEPPKSAATPRMRPTLRQWLKQPRSEWNAADDANKFALYTRVSLHSMVIIFGVSFFLIPFARQREDNFDPVSSTPIWFAGALTVVMVALAVAVVELSPSLNIRPRRSAMPWIGISAAVGGLTWIACLPVYNLADSFELDLVASLLGVQATLLLSFAVLPWLRHAWWWGIGLAALSFAIFGPSVPVIAIVAMVTVRLSVWMVQVVKDLAKARHTEAALQVSEERLRFAQELHDTMGQHLAAISLKAQVAKALAKRNDDRLEAELDELQNLASQSTSEMRQVVRGYRAVNLATELRGATELLESAGIRVQVQGLTTDIPATYRELCGWVVRETATNVLRHSRATEVSFFFSDATLSILNNGAISPMGRSGGLETLHSKAQRLDAHLSFNRYEDAGECMFRTECRFPPTEGADRA